MVTTKTATRVKTKQELPQLVDMLEAGVHFGHERSKKNPHMDSNIFMLRNRMAIINLEKTHQALGRAVDFLSDLASDPGKEILFVGTKRQAREIVRKYATSAKMPYVTKRWLGGTLTNFSTIQKSIEKLDELKSISAGSLKDKMTKKEKLVHDKEINRLEQVLEGIMNLRKLPAAIIVVGAYDEKLAVQEAIRVGLPVVGITDTNANPKLVDYPIPANDDAIRAIDLIVNALTQAIINARSK